MLTDYCCINPANALLTSSPCAVHRPRSRCFTPPASRPDRAAMQALRLGNPMAPGRECESWTETSHQPHTVPQRGLMPLTARSQALLYEPTPLLRPSPRTRSPALGYSVGQHWLHRLRFGRHQPHHHPLAGPADKSEGDALLGVTFEVEPWPLPTLGAFS